MWSICTPPLNLLPLSMRKSPGFYELKGHFLRRSKMWKLKKKMTGEKTFYLFQFNIYSGVICLLCASGDERWVHWLRVSFILLLLTLSYFLGFESYFYPPSLQHGITNACITFLGIGKRLPFQYIKTVKPWKNMINYMFNVPSSVPILNLGSLKNQHARGY